MWLSSKSLFKYTCPYTRKEMIQKAVIFFTRKIAVKLSRYHFRTV